MDFTASYVNSLDVAHCLNNCYFKHRSHRLQSPLTVETTEQTKPNQIKSNKIKPNVGPKSFFQE